jgi:hypothetical protein
MLLELRRVEFSLRQIAVSGNASRARAELPLNAHRQAMLQVDLFRSATSAAVFDFLSCVADVEHGIDLIATGHVQPSEERDWEMRCRATFAANRVDAVKAALLDEGGQSVTQRDISRERVDYPDDPRLEPPSFHQPNRDLDLTRPK